MNVLNTANKSGSTAGLITAAGTAIGYLSGIDFNLLLVDWGVVLPWLATLSGVSFVLGKDTHNNQGFKLSARSIRNLNGVNEDLVEIVHRALELTEIDFVVISGVRTPEEQKELYDAGDTPIMDSMHLYGLAIDVAAWVDDDISWDLKYYKKIKEAFIQAGKERGIIVKWGGDWKSVDGPHFQLSETQYPKTQVKLA